MVAMGTDGTMDWWDVYKNYNANYTHQLHPLHSALHWTHDIIDMILHPMWCNDVGCSDSDRCKLVSLYVCPYDVSSTPLLTPDKEDTV